MILQYEQEYRKLMVRPLDLIACECWDRGERLMLPLKFKNLLYFDPLFVCKPQQAVAVYYNFTDKKQNASRLIKYLENNLPLLLKNKKEFDKNCRDVGTLILKDSENYQRLFFLIQEIWPMIAVSNFLGSTEVYTVSKKLRNLCIKVRKESDDVLHPAMAYLSSVISRKIKESHPGLADYVSYLLVSEFINKNIPDKKDMIKRSRGYLFHKGKLSLSIEKYLRQQRFKLVENDHTEITCNLIEGQSACHGNIKGNAKIVFELSDLAKVKRGDILVTSMTTPDMFSALHKAAGIITDEGGITCHAAIFAREMKKPCIIGTKVATKLLKDGDMVEVNANKGIVKIL